MERIAMWWEICLSRKDPKNQFCMHESLSCNWTKTNYSEKRLSVLMFTAPVRTWQHSTITVGAWPVNIYHYLSRKGLGRNGKKLSSIFCLRNGQMGLESSTTSCHWFTHLKLCALISVKSILGWREYQIKYVNGKSVMATLKWTRVYSQV